MESSFYLGLVERSFQAREAVHDVVQGRFDVDTGWGSGVEVDIVGLNGSIGQFIKAVSLLTEWPISS